MAFKWGGSKPRAVTISGSTKIYDDHGNFLEAEGSCKTTPSGEEEYCLKFIAGHKEDFNSTPNEQKNMTNQKSITNLKRIKDKPLKSSISLGIFVILGSLFFIFCKSYIIIKDKGPNIIPILAYNRSGIPLTNIKIDGSSFLTILDLGCNGQIALHSKSIDKLANKEYTKTETMYGISGTPQERHLFKVPKISINTVSFSNVEIQKIPASFVDAGRFSETGKLLPRQEQGSIGWDLFANSKILIDCPNNKIYIIDNFSDLTRLGYKTKNFHQMPMILDRNLIEIDGVLNGKHTRITLDTGCSFNILNQVSCNNKTLEESLWEKENFKEFSSVDIGGKNFGPIEFRCVPINLPIKLEAILGMDFFENHQVFLDFENKIIQIH